jgi:hypothetical protein
VDEHVRAAQRAHIQGLVTRIQHENLLHLAELYLAERGKQGGFPALC